MNNNRRAFFIILIIGSMLLNFFISSAFCENSSSALTPTAPSSPVLKNNPKFNANNITLTWYPSDKDTNISITDYIIREKIENGVYFDLVSTNSTSYTVTGLKPTTSYSFIVHAGNNGIFSPPSNEVTVTTLREAPMSLGEIFSKIIGSIPISIILFGSGFVIIITYELKIKKKMY